MTPGYQLAQDWARAEKSRLALQGELEKTKLELDNVKIRQEALVKDLRATVGSVHPQRLYDLGGGHIVMVSVAGGVQLVALEKAANG